MTSFSQYHKSFIYFLIVFLSIFQGISQTSAPDLIGEVVMKIDTATYSTNWNTLTEKGVPQLYFEFDKVNSICEVTLIPAEFAEIDQITLLPSADFELIDSLLNINNVSWRFKVKFKQLTTSEFLQFNFLIASPNLEKPYVFSQKLFPYTFTTASIRPSDDKLYIGEEQYFKIETNRPNNINYASQWTHNQPIDYKITNEQGEMRIYLLPRKIGKQTLVVPLTLRRPMRDSLGKMIYNLPPIVYDFEVKETKLFFLNSNKKEVNLENPVKGEGIEIELAYHPEMRLKKTYRIEQQEEPGGILVAEVFTRSILSNNRILCWLRTFNPHRQSDGYLYLKDGDVAKFISNFSITLPTSITGLEVIPKKGNNSAGQSIFPGEHIQIKITGEGLHKSNFNFEGLAKMEMDTLQKSEKEVLISAHVPIDINETKIELMNYSKPTGKSLSIKEFQAPRNFDFVNFKIEEEKDRILDEVDQIVFIDHTLDDIIIAFDRNKIDEGKKIFGKQYLSIDIQVTSEQNTLIDKRLIEDIVICPGGNSPRSGYYDSKDCQQSSISVNQYIRQQTRDLDKWSAIEITIKHSSKNYSDQGFSKKVTFILRKYTSFDLDISFPAGLLTKKIGVEGFSNLGGVSMAMIAQFSFYNPKRIAKYRPYKLGAGFLAFNAFNFNENNTNRDVGVVILGSLYPVGSKGKLSFPLYVGGGYFLSESKFFYLLGPGIRLSL